MLALRIFCLVVLALRAWGEPVQDETLAKNRALSFVRTKLDLPPNAFLRATRREDWEDEVFGVQTKLVGQIRKAAMLFEVQDTGYEIISDSEVLYHSTTDSKNRWIVGISVKTGDVYGLLGFDRANEAFNELVGPARIRIGSSEEARAWGYAFVQMVFGPTQGRPLGRRRDLQRFLEDAFDSGTASKWRPASLDGWLNRLKTVPIEPTVRSVSEDFELALTFMISAADGPEAIRIALRIKPNGQIQTLLPIKVYPAMALKPDSAKPR